MRPAGVTALSAFFLFGTIAGGLSALSLLFPGSVLEPMWRINSRGHEGLVRMGPWGIALMVAVCAACGWSAVGLWRGTKSGYWTAVVMLVTNLGGDLVNGLIGDRRALIGVPVAALILVYLGSGGVRGFFVIARGAGRHRAADGPDR